MMPRKMSPERRPALLRTLLFIFLALVFALGGGSRGDIASLVILRPLAFIFLGLGVVNMRIDDACRFRSIWAGALIIAVMTIIHLLPLPATLWHNLPGRDLMVEADQLLGLKDIARPLAMVPWAAKNTLFSLALPLATVALMSSYRQDWFKPMVAFLALAGLASALLSVLQILGPEGNVFYFYKVTNANSAVGLFANRNHNAVFLAALLPVLAVFAVQGKEARRGKQDWRGFRVFSAVSGGTFFLLVIVISGSRAGLLAAILAILLIPAVLGMKLAELIEVLSRPLANSAIFAARMRSGGNWAKRFVLAMVVAILGTLILVVPLISSRVNSLERFGEPDNRTAAWTVIMRQVWEFFPWGSGIGSFVEVYQIAEPTELIGETYLNHAHNDVLEVALTAGLPGMLLMAAFAVWLIVTGKKIFFNRVVSDSVNFQARLGWITISILALASVVDYPLRVPSLACLAMVAICWIADGSASLRGDKGELDHSAREKV